MKLTKKIFSSCMAIAMILNSGIVTMNDYSIPVNAATAYRNTGIYYDKIDSNDDGVYDSVEISSADEYVTNITIPTSIEGLPVVSIKNFAFNEHKYLENIVIPDSVYSIGEGAFCDCEALENVLLPCHLSIIDNYTFLGCSCLKKIDIPNSVKTIGKGAFFECKSLKEIYLPNNVNTIGYDAFNGCSILRRITINNTLCAIHDTDTTITNITLVDSTSFNGVIVGHADSTAQSYAEKYGRKFEAIQDEPKAEKGTFDNPYVDENGVVNWEAINGAVTYKVGKIVNGSIYYSPKTTETSYKFKNIPQSDYKVFIVAFDNKGNRTWGKKADMAVGSMGKVTDLAVLKDGTVVWSPVRNAVAYKVGKIVDNKTYYGSKVTDTKYSLANKPKKSYKLFVVAFDKNGNKTKGSVIKINA